MFILALDEGTTSARASLVDAAGTIVASAQQEIAQHYPASGWVEEDAEEIWAAQYATLKTCLNQARVGHEVGCDQLLAIGIANQRETTIVWDRRTGKPIYPAIVWQDRRTADYCQSLCQAGHEQLIRERTGLVVDPYFSASKLRWILDTLPEARNRAVRGELAFGTVDSWLVWKLTGGMHHVTDLTNASRTLLCSLKTGDWDLELLELFQIPHLLLPRIVDTSQNIGIVAQLPEVAGVAVTGIAGDQQAALFGQGCYETGEAKCTYGTGCFLLQNIGIDPIISTNGLLTTVAWRIGGNTQFALEGSVFIGGAVVQWLRDGLKAIARAADSEVLAGSVADTGGVYFVPAFAGLGAPYWDAHARGTISGITGGTTLAHLARAALESIAFQVTDLMEAFSRSAAVPVTFLRADGGAAENKLLMQFQADLLRVPVECPRESESTTLGAAYLAGLGAGVWPDLASLKQLARQRSSLRFMPQLPEEDVTQRRVRWARAVSRALDPNADT